MLGAGLFLVTVFGLWGSGREDLVFPGWVTLVVSCGLLGLAWYLWRLAWPTAIVVDAQALRVMRAPGGELVIPRRAVVRFAGGGLSGVNAGVQVRYRDSENHERTVPLNNGVYVRDDGERFAGAALRRELVRQLGLREDGDV